MEDVCAMFKAKLISTMPQTLCCCCDLKETHQAALEIKLIALKTSLNEEEG